MRRSVAILLAGLVFLTAACRPSERPGTPPRHVVLVSFSGMRPDHMSAYLYTRPTTGWPMEPVPRADGNQHSIDDLAASGVVFANAYAPSPLDAPSAATLLTGKPPWAHGVIENEGQLPEGLRTLAERFREAGFETTALVGGSELDELRGHERGFTHFTDGLSDDQVLAQAKTWTTGSFDQPRLLWMHLAGPRWAYEAGVIPERPRALGSDPDSADPGGDGWDLSRAFVDPEWKGSTNLEAQASRDSRFGPIELQYVRDRYDGSVAETSWRVRDFLRTLAEASSAAYDDTLFVVAGLRGVELGEHFSDPVARLGQRFGHDVLLETTLEVPLILRHPRSLTGRRILAEPVGLADIAPTLCEWFGIEPRNQSLSRSLLALTDSYVERSFDSQSPLACIGGQHAAVSIGDGTWRATWSIDPAGAQLFLVSRDSSQRSDLAEERPDELRGWAFEARRQLSNPGPAVALREVLEIGSKARSE